MTCPKCQGFMVRDNYKAWQGITCLNCGLAWDRTIARNKFLHQEPPEVTAARLLAESIFNRK